RGQDQPGDRGARPRRPATDPAPAGVRDRRGCAGLRAEPGAHPEERRAAAQGRRFRGAAAAAGDAALSARAGLELRRGRRGGQPRGGTHGPRRAADRLPGRPLPALESDRHPRRRPGVCPVSSATLVAERALKVLSRLRERLAQAGQATAQPIRIFLGREAWTADGLRAVGEELRRRPRRTALAGGVVALGLLALVALTGGDPARGAGVASVQEGPFQVTIVEGGTLQALRSMTYASNI